MEVVEIDGREFVIVGTAHISRESVELVREVIENETPDCVCLELDAQRHEALSSEDRWKQLDLREVIRKRQLATLLVNLLLASYQKRLGGQLGMMPGSELLEASRVASENGIPISFCDRDIRVTLRRAWSSLSWWRKLELSSTVLASAFDRTELSEEDLRNIRRKDVLNEMMSELGKSMPTLKQVLIDERDAYLAQRIREADGDRIVAVVGAGHVTGMRAALARGTDVDIAEFDQIPPVSPVLKWVGWGIPALIVGALVTIGATKGPAAMGENALYWLVANSVPTALGGLAALGHPLTIAIGGLAAPFTSLTPVIGAGYVAAFVQTWVAPPLVHEFETVGDDIAHLSRWWRSRLLKIFLVFVLTTLGSLLGTGLGGVEIVSNLF
ncbi:MAG: TraB/GumN family protein [Myxococcota bacterium]|nr:TraB/GumN family protein [Myxococcota bacterium]